VLALRLAIILTAAGGVFGVWVLNLLVQGVEFKDALGFSIASRTNPEQLTFSRLLFYLWNYLAYFTLQAAAILHLLVHALREAWVARRGRFARFTVLVFGLTGAMGFAMVRHSWRAHYNYPEPLRIMGRYGIYFAVLFVILAAVTFVRIVSSKERPPKAFTLGALAFHVAAVVASYAYMLTHHLGGSSGRMITDRGAVDVYRLYLLGQPGLAVALLFALGTACVLLMRQPPRWAIPAFFAVLIAWSAWGLPAFHQRIEDHQFYAYHARQMAEVVVERDTDADRVFVGEEVLEGTSLTVTRWGNGFRAGLNFWGVPRPPFRTGPSPDAEQSDRPLETMVLRRSGVDDPSLVFRIYEFRGEQYVIGYETVPPLED
jgi:hypothetical protein